MNIVFLCTANSCRSQMAEAWARSLFPADWRVASCGLLTYPIVPETIEAMADVGLDMEGQESQSIDEYDLDDFDLVVTLSRQSGRFLPELKDPRRHLAIPVKDPMSFRGTPQEVRAAFQAGRDRIGEIVRDIAAGRLGPGTGE